MLDLQHKFSAALLRRSWTCLEERRRKRLPNSLQTWTGFLFFYFLNTRSLTEGVKAQKDNLLPDSDSYDERFNFLNEFFRYLEQWKTSVQTRPGNFTASERAKMFLTHQTYKGLVMTIKSFPEAARYLLDNGVKYVLSNKFCQDPLEEHFGRHRSLSRRNENPNLYPFGYQENTIRQQRIMAMIIQRKEIVEKGREENKASSSPTAL